VPSEATSLARVASACRSDADDRGLRVGVLDALRAIAPYDAFAWLLTDPETTVGAAPLAQVPCLDRLPALIRLRYLDRVNRWTRADPGPAVAWAGRAAPDDEWRDFVTEYGVVDVASVVFADRFGCWGFLDLWRARHPFTAAELDLLTRAAALITPALRACQATAFEKPAVEKPAVEKPAVEKSAVEKSALEKPAVEKLALEKSAEPRTEESALVPAVLLLSPDLEVRRQTAEADGYLRALLPTEEDRRPVPAAAYNVGAQLLAREAGVDDHPATARVAMPDGRWLTFRAARLGDPEDRTSDIAVTIAPVTPGERLDLFARAHGLTPRETELLRCLADGDSTRTIAGRLYLSEFTVQDHLKSVFDKTSVRSRECCWPGRSGPDEAGPDEAGPEATSLAAPGPTGGLAAGCRRRSVRVVRFR